MIKGLGNTSRRTHERHNATTSPAFTIVELLIVVVVIAILAAITIISYNGIAGRAKETSLKSDLKNGAQQIEIAKVETGSYPADTSTVKKGTGTTFQYSPATDTFCLTATNSSLLNKAFYVTNGGSIQEGTCPGHSSGGVVANGNFIQTITSTNCPSSRTRAVDARDNHSYWVQKLPDGKCWMLTNLAYAGAGTNTYGDTKTLQNGTSDPDTTFLLPKYYVSPNTNLTTEPTAPSVSADGGATNPQYGYLYNWCAAMGVQTSTSACASTSTPVPNQAITICPAGWRLPVGNGGEFAALNTAVNDGFTSVDTGLRSSWLAQKGGYWSSGFDNQGNAGYYWSSNQISANYSYVLYFNGSSVNASLNMSKDIGGAIRCVAS